MDNKEMIMQATIQMINECGDHVSDITVREICRRAGVGLGLVNYYFGSKDALIELCVERIVNGIVDAFQSMGNQTDGLTPYAKLEYLGNLTFDFLFDHYAVSKISVLSDMRSPNPDDNTHRTYRAYLPLVAACHPEWEEGLLQRKTFCLVTCMQHAFIRHKAIGESMGVNLQNREDRRSFHAQLLREIIGE